MSLVISSPGVITSDIIINHVITVSVTGDNPLLRSIVDVFTPSGTTGSGATVQLQGRNTGSNVDYPLTNISNAQFSASPTGPAVNAASGSNVIPMGICSIVSTYQNQTGATITSNTITPTLWYTTPTPIISAPSNVTGSSLISITYTLPPGPTGPTYKNSSGTSNYGGPNRAMTGSVLLYVYLGNTLQSTLQLSNYSTGSLVINPADLPLSTGIVSFVGGSSTVSSGSNTFVVSWRDVYAEAGNTTGSLEGDHNAATGNAIVGYYPSALAPTVIASSNPPYLQYSFPTQPATGSVSVSYGHGLVATGTSYYPDTNYFIPPLGVNPPYTGGVTYNDVWGNVSPQVTVEVTGATFVTNLGPEIIILTRRNDANYIQGLV